MSRLTAKEWGLYIGQKVLYLCDGIDGRIIFELIGVSDTTLHIKDYCEEYEVKLRFCKPILRSLDQMTEEEKIELKDVIENGSGKILPLKTADNKNFSSNPADYNDLFTCSQVAAIDWLTQKGFAIRNEFERGVAVKEKSEHEVI